MSKPVINLRNMRKQRDRVAKKLQADENAVRFGQPKSERILQATKVDKARRMLDAHKLDDE